MSRAWWREKRRSARQSPRIGCRGVSASRAVRPGGARFTGQWPAPERASTLFGCLDGFAVQVTLQVTVDRVGRTAFGDPGGAEIGQFGLKTLDLEPERGAAGER